MSCQLNQTLITAFRDCLRSYSAILDVVEQVNNQLLVIEQHRDHKHNKYNPRGDCPCCQIAREERAESGPFDEVDSQV